MGTAVTRPSSSLTEEVYQRLRNDLLACRIAPGERLRIADLCEQLGVSLGAVREALSRLTSEGLVLNEPQKGFRAAPISANELRDLTEVRVDIEGLCLQRAIAHGDVRWEGEILGALHQLARTPQYAPDDNRRMNDAWSTMHSQFHEALISACDSPVLMQIRRQLYDQSERYRRLTAPLGKRKVIAEVSTSSYSSSLGSVSADPVANTSTGSSQAIHRARSKKCTL